MTIKQMEEDEAAETASEQPLIDSKYRLIILAAQRSKQIQRGAHPRVNLDPQKHKPTRIALEEVQGGQVRFKVDPIEGIAKPAEG